MSLFLYLYICIVLVKMMMVMMIYFMDAISDNVYVIIKDTHSSNEKLTQ